MYIEGFTPELKKYMHHLLPKDQELVEHYYGLNGRTAISINEIAAVVQDKRIPAEKVEERLYRSLRTLHVAHAKAAKS